MGLKYLDALRAGRVFSVGLVLTATAVNGAQFVLFNSKGGNRVIYALQADFSVSAAMEIDWFTLNTDPGLTAGAKPANSSPPDQLSQATIEAAVAAQPTTLAQLGSAQTAPGGPIATPLDRPIRLAAGFGLLVSSAAVAGKVSLTFGWVEVGPDSDYG